MSTVEQVLAELAERATQLTGGPVPPGQGLLASGLTSENLLTLLAYISDRWQVDLAAESLFDGGDLASLAARVHSTSRDPGRRPIPPSAAMVTAPGATAPADRRRALRSQIWQVIDQAHE